MSAVNDILAETSILSSSQINFDKSRISAKRFRPLIRCSHINKQTNEQCTADGFMECVHCDKICCLIHITQHQDELKQLRDSLIEVRYFINIKFLVDIFVVVFFCQEASEVYITLTSMQVTDSREQLQSNLALWKKRMLNKIERMYEKLLGKYFNKAITRF